jgi:RNA polymerase sigma-70 factor (ECF subfamily)
MQPLENEYDLVKKAQTGDKAAVGTLYEIYVNTIFHYISYRVESDEVAEDLTADVFLRMVRALPEYHYTGAPFGAWLFRIASNRITDHYRENKRGPSTPIHENYKSDTGEIYDQVEKEEEHNQLRKALANLSEDYQNIIILRFIKDMSHTEVAVATGKSEAAVRVTQHRALKALAVELDKITGHKTGGKYNV